MVGMLKGPRTIRSLTLFVIGLTFLNITYTMISWYKPLTLPIRKGKEHQKELSWLDDPKNEIKRLEKEKLQPQWLQQSPLLSLIQNSTRLKNSTKETRESQRDLENITITRNNTLVTNLNVTSNTTEQKLDREESTQKRNSTLNNNTIITEFPVTNASSLLMAQILGSNKSVTTVEETTAMPLCDNPPDLGPIQVNKTDLELDFVDKKFLEVHWGGRYFPPNCTARHKVAIIAPYRDRQQQLAIFLNHMHPFLMKQQIEYGIFIVEQEGRKEFNRAKLMNVGFVEAQRLKAGGWQCFIFHDIDLLPLDTRNMYSCPRQPRHMSASIDKLNFMLPYEDIFGGVSALTLEQFTKINGFSNKYWGWGGEDDDLVYRLKKRNYHIARYKISIARYAMLDHKKSIPSPKRYQLLSQTSKTFQKDGLSTLEYELVQVMQYHLYTNILVNIDERS